MLVCRCFGKKGPVRQGRPQAGQLAAELLRFFGKKSARKALADEPDRQRRGVAEVGIVVAIVAELIQHDFIGREVVYALQLCTQAVNGQQEAGLAALVFRQPLPQMPYRAQAEDDLQRWLQAPRAGNGRLQQRHIFRRAVPPPLKAAAGLLVAVDNYPALGHKRVGGGCPERDDEHFRLPQKGLRCRQLLVDDVQCNGPVGMRIPAVKIKVPPDVLHTKQFMGRIRLTVNDPLQDGRQGGRLVYDAKRIEAYREMMVCQVAADVFDKAGAEAEAGRLVVNGEGVSSRGDCCLQWYFFFFHRFVTPGDGWYWSANAR